MFNCNQCHKTSKPRTRQNKVVIERRERTYYSIIIKHNIIKHLRFLQYERKDRQILENLERQGWKSVHENFSKGWETVKEKNVCEECYEKSQK